MAATSRNQIYETNIVGKLTTEEGGVLIRDIPLLQDLRDQGLISVGHQNNAIHGKRTQHQQVSERKNGANYCSAAFKFAVAPVSHGQHEQSSLFDGSMATAYHGNVVGTDIANILRDGLRAYNKDSYTVKNGTSRVGDTLLIPSSVVALECYGYHVVGQNTGKIYRIALQTKCKTKNIVKGVDTYNLTQLDWTIPRNEVEWSLPAHNVVVTGVLVKHYHSRQAISQLERLDKNQFRIDRRTS
jgi:hypothetical protein